MKYGIIIYKDTDNIGDDILSYAASRFLPQIDYIIDREQLDLFAPDRKELVSVIMNGWFLHHKSHWPPSPYINPLFVGIHFTDNLSFGITDSYLNGIGADYLRAHAPIGCRDDSTLNKMQSRKIDSYFSGCLTLTLNSFSCVTETNKYVLVDVPDFVYQKVTDIVGAEHTEKLTHKVDANYTHQSWTKRSATVETYLKKYQSAKAVITTRLHCALPCLALGTPVILLMDENSDTRARMGSFKQFVLNCSVNDFMNGKFGWGENISNPAGYLVLRNHLINTCSTFIEQTKGIHAQDSLSRLPELNVFNSLWKKPTEWQRGLTSADSVCVSRSEWTNLLNAKNWLENQLSFKNNRINELENILSELEHGKQWLEQHSKKQEEYITNLKSWLEELERGKQWLEQHSAEQEQYINELTKHANTNK